MTWSSNRVPWMNHQNAFLSFFSSDFPFASPVAFDHPDSITKTIGGLAMSGIMWDEPHGFAFPSLFSILRFGSRRKNVSVDMTWNICQLQYCGCHNFRPKNTVNLVDYPIMFVIRQGRCEWRYNGGVKPSKQSDLQEQRRPYISCRRMLLQFCQDMCKSWKQAVEDRNGVGNHLHRAKVAIGWVERNEISRRYLSCNSDDSSQSYLTIPNNKKGHHCPNQRDDMWSNNEFQPLKKGNVQIFPAYCTRLIGFGNIQDMLLSK